MVKKILRIFAGILSMPFFLASAFILYCVAYVTVEYVVGAMDGLNVFVYFVAIMIIPITFYIGWRLLFLNKTIEMITKISHYFKNREHILYEAELERRRQQEQLEKEQEKEAEANRKQIEASYRYSKKYEVPIKTKEEKNREILEKWQKLKESYVDKPKSDKPQTFKMCMCEKSNKIWFLVTMLGIMIFVLGCMMMGQIANFSIDMPLATTVVAILMAAIAVFGGVLVFVASFGIMNSEKDKIFVLTDQRLIYALDLDSLYHDNSLDDIPSGRIDRMIYYHQKRKENKEVTEQIKAIKADKEDLYKRINAEVNNTGEERTVVNYLVKKLNSPQLITIGMHTKIKYWNEDADKWEKFVLPKHMEHYDEICQVVRSRRTRL